MSSVFGVSTPVALGVTLAAVAASSLLCRRRKAAKDGNGPQPAWEWFCVSNFIAVGAFISSVWYLMSFWMANTDRAHSAAYAFTQPAFAISLLCAIGSLLYFFAFFGVAFIHNDVETLSAPLSSPLTSDKKIQNSEMNPEYDCDVLIVGMGTVGASLATVLARDGKKVVVIERDMAMKDSIVGELMQPGGIRVLERMGVADCAKTSAIDPIVVDGYVCITPCSGPQQDLVLTYPQADPRTPAEYFGMLTQSDTRKIRINKVHEKGAQQDDDGSSSPFATHNNAGPADGIDEQPRGRSFHNHRFVHQLRLKALQEKNVDMHLGTAKKLLTAGNLREPALAFVGTTQGSSNMTADELEAKYKHMSMNDIRTSFAPAPQFAGFDADDKPKGSLPAPAARAHITKTATASRVNADNDDDTIMGVAWVDSEGVERVTTARLTVVADGMYSVLRSSLHKNTPKTVSHFCGYILHHDAFQTPLPYPNRGHVLMADPNPVLLYQISSTETRVLVDIPGKLPDVENGDMRRHMEKVIAPQMPECVRPFFLKAVQTQEPYCMPNRSLPAVPVQKRGAVLLGDSWNMRHPLTGGGMTVALKDTEMFWNSVRFLDLQADSWAVVERNLARFQTQRTEHASTINILANALYRVFSRPASDVDGTRDRLRAACIDYLSAGGACTAGPVGLLAGLTPKPGVLVSHFFAVALHAMRRALLPIPTPTGMRQGYDLLRIACIIIMPLLRNEKATILASEPMLWLTNLLFPWKNVDISTM